MKLITLVRHAKSSWNYPELSDFERPLNDRGRRDAPLMAQHIAASLPPPSRVMTSPATRAMATTRILADALALEDAQLRILPQLYMASRASLLELLAAQDGNPAHLLLVGHNPGLSELAHSLAPCPFEDLPTCAVAHLHLDIKSWKALTPGCGQLVDYLFPKNLLKAS